MQLFPKMMCIATKQEIDNAALVAQVQEKNKQPSYAQAVRTAAGSGPGWLLSRARK